MANDRPREAGSPQPGDGADTASEVDLASLTGEQMSELLSRIPGAVEGIKQGWQDYLDGNCVPISELL